MAFGKNNKAATPAAPAAASATPARRPSKYARAKDVKIGVQANYLRPGTYLVLVQRHEEGVTRSKEDFVSTHVTVLAVDDTRTDLDRRFGGALHREGEDASWFQLVRGDYFDQNMLKFAIVASNMTQEEIAAEEEKNDISIVEEMLTNQPFAGVVLECRVTTRIKKAAKDKGVAEAALTATDVSTVVDWVRRVNYAEVKEAVDEKIAAQFIPNLDELVASEAS